MRKSSLIRLLLAVHLALVFAFVFAPIVASFVFSFNSDRFPSLPLGTFTLHWWEKALSAPGFAEAARRSIIVALTTAVISTIIGFTAAYTDHRHRFFGKSAFLLLALLPPTIPPIIMAVAMLGWLSTLHLSGAMHAVVLAHVVVGSPFAMAIIRLRLEQMDQNLEPAAWNLGASEGTAVRTVVLPFARPAIVAALCLTAALSFDEFTIAWFVSGLDKTIPVMVLEILTGNIDPQVNAIGSLVIVVSIALVAVAQLLVLKRSSTPEGEP